MGPAVGPLRTSPDPDRRTCGLRGSGDRKRDGADLGFLLGNWGTAAGDLNADGTTDGADLGTLLGGWGNCP